MYMCCALNSIVGMNGLQITYGVDERVNFCLSCLRVCTPAYARVLCVRAAFVSTYCLGLMLPKFMVCFTLVSASIYPAVSSSTRQLIRVEPSRTNCYERRRLRLDWQLLSANQPRPPRKRGIWLAYRSKFGFNGSFFLTNKFSLLPTANLFSKYTFYYYSLLN